MLRIILPLLLLLPAIASAITPRQAITDVPMRSGGIYYAYPVTADSLPPVPDGYRPLLIAHYGRHGSRWMLDYTQFDEVLDALSHADSLGNLTPRGREVLVMVDSIHRHALGHVGELTPLGVSQHKAIASRMFRRFPSLFSGVTPVEARSSIEPRCIVSMSAFTEALKELNPSLVIDRHATPSDYSGFIASSTPRQDLHKHKSARWRRDLAAFRDSVIPVDRIMSELFINPSLVDGISANRFIRFLHNISVSTQDTALDIPLHSLFTPDELYAIWQGINYNMYVQHACAAVADYSGPECAVPLLSRFISLIDSAAVSGDPAVALHFGHDTSLIRLLALMDIEGCSNVEADPARYAEAWQDWRVSPMGANLQVILFTPDSPVTSSPAADAFSLPSQLPTPYSSLPTPNSTLPTPLVLIRHNEQPVRIAGLPGGPYYRWSDLRDHWLSRIPLVTRP